MKRHDWTLLAIDLANGKGLSAVQLQKALFLLERGVPQELGTSLFYHFSPYNYGPFDSTVYTDAEILSHEGLINITKPTGRYTVYTVTPEGAVHAKELASKASPRAVQHLKNVVTWIQGLTFAQLLRAIYSRYPEMKANSVFNY
jgi:uncharacterized protein